jgi:hypothetical protein
MKIQQKTLRLSIGRAVVLTVLTVSVLLVLLFLTVLTAGAILLLISVILLSAVIILIGHSNTSFLRAGFFRPLQK